MKHSGGKGETTNERECKRDAKNRPDRRLKIGLNGIRIHDPEKLAQRSNQPLLSWLECRTSLECRLETPRAGELAPSAAR